jgi:single-strand DNA-binding protein
MGTLNKVMLIGNLGRDPEMRTANSGNLVCHLRLATRNWRSTNGNGTEETTEWHNVVAFGKLAELGAGRLKKGSRVYVEGRIHTRSYQPEQGEVKWFTEIIANDIQFLDSAANAGDAAPESKDEDF